MDTYRKWFIYYIHNRYRSKVGSYIYRSFVLRKFLRLLTVGKTMADIIWVKIYFQTKSTDIKILIDSYNYYERRLTK